MSNKKEVTKVVAMLYLALVLGIVTVITWTVVTWLIKATLIGGFVLVIIYFWRKTNKYI